MGGNERSGRQKCSVLDFDGKNTPLSLKNTYFWNDIV
jgi:hypothetical protein